MRQLVFGALDKDKLKPPIPQMLLLPDSHRASTVNSVTMTQAPALLTGNSQSHISSPLLPASTPAKTSYG